MTPLQEVCNVVVVVVVVVAVVGVYRAAVTYQAPVT